MKSFSYFILSFVVALAGALVAGTANFAYAEVHETFVSQSLWVGERLMQPGGAALLLQSWIVQWMGNGLVGAILASLLLAAVAFFALLFIKRMGAQKAFAPLAALPSAALFFLQYNTNYQYAGTISLLLVFVALWATTYAQGKWRVLVAVAITVLLFLATGAAAMLYAVLVLLSQAISEPKRSLEYLLCPVVAWMFAYLSVRMGYVIDLQHAATPAAYFNWRMPAPGIVWLPWCLSLIAVVVALGLAKVRTQGKAPYIEAGASMAALIGFCAFGANAYLDRGNEMFKALYVDAANGDWQGVIDKCEGKMIDNPLLQNILNMALAHEGLLSESLMDQPCIDIRSIYMPNIKQPYNYVLLSEIYYAMGHVALAQRYAFEGNQVMGGYSPKMLQMLVRTNIIYGQYAVAEKYINLLEHTRYADWARGMRRFLGDDAAVMADAELGALRRCLPADNKFSGLGGLDLDLKAIVAANPDYAAARQYLGALYMLSADGEHFMEALPSLVDASQPLPRAFAEAALAFTPDGADTGYVIDENTQARYKAFRRTPNTRQLNYWSFLMRY